MKTKVTKNQIIDAYKHVIKLSYCEAPALLKYKTPNHYTKGNNGWNADVYVINNDTAIVTGYKSFGISPGHDIVSKYNKHAEYVDKSETDYEKKKFETECLLIDFIDTFKKKNCSEVVA